jgi:hypothetical protein
VRREFLLMPLLAMCIVACGVNVKARHPNAIDQLDSNTYDTLIVAQSVLDNAKVAVKQGKLPDSAKPVINAGGTAYSVVRELWLEYRANQNTPLANQIIAATPELNKIIMQLRGLGVPE